jgi:hypothetical protein
MSDLPQPSNSASPSEAKPSAQTGDLKPVTPLRCVIGALLSGGFGFGMYLMTHAIALSFAAHKVDSSNLTVQRISVAVRTLVIGLTTMGTGIFGLAALGLLGLAMQLTIQQLRHKPNSDIGA